MGIEAPPGWKRQLKSGAGPLGRHLTGQHPCLSQPRPADIAINVLFTVEMVLMVVAAGGALAYLRRAPA